MVMLDFICMGFAELYRTGSKQKIQNENVSTQEWNQEPLVFQAGALSHWAMQTVNYV